MEKKLVTENHVNVYYDCNPSLHGFSLSLYLRAGCLYEAEKENGISHFYEHVAVRNLNAHMGGELYRTLDRNGLTFNASTGKEHIWFEMTGASAHFALAASFMVRLFEPITLSSQEIEIERNRVKAEIREDDEKTSLYCLRRKAVWEDTPLSRSILGTPSTLNRFGKTALNRLQRTLFSIDNLFFYITGNVPEEEIRSFGRTISTLSLSEEPCGRENLAQVPPHFGRRETGIHTKWGDCTRISFSFDWKPEGFSYEEASLLYDVLFCGETSLLFQALSETTGMIYSFSPSIDIYRNIGVIGVEYEVSTQQLLPSVQALIGVLSGVKESLPDALNCVMPFYVDNAGLLSDDCSEHNWTSAYEGHFMNLPYRSVFERADAYLAIKPDRICALARALFRPENMTVCLKGNLRRLPIAELEERIAWLISEGDKR